MTDESARIDLNMASETLLKGLFQNIGGVDAATAERWGYLNRALPPAELRPFVTKLARLGYRSVEVRPRERICKTQFELVEGVQSVLGAIALAVTFSSGLGRQQPGSIGWKRAWKGSSVRRSAYRQYTD